MNRFARYTPLVVPSVVAVVLIVLCSIVQGLWTDRWTSTVSAQLQKYADAFGQIPMVVGDWEGDDSGESSERELAAAGAVGHLSRVYRNPKRGETVSVYMICGPSRNVAVHTPDACYPDAGFRPESESQKYSFKAGQSQAEFFTNVFLREEPTGTQRLRVFWAWNAEGNWESPNWPRVRYGGRTALNKVYLISPAPHGQTVDQSPVLEFAHLFIPEVNRVLFPDQTNSLASLAPAPTPKAAKPKADTPAPDPVPPAEPKTPPAESKTPPAESKTPPAEPKTPPAESPKEEPAKG